MKIGTRVKRNDTSEVVRVVEVLPVGTWVFCRIESMNGDLTLVPLNKLRAITESN